MDFEKFTENVQADLLKTLSDVFPDVSVEPTQVSKLQGQSYNGLAIKHDDTAIAASINLDQFYELYENGAVYEDVLQNLTDFVVTNFSQTPDIDVNALKNYDEMKQHLIVQIVGTDSNTEKLSTIPHRKMEDMAMVYRFSLGEISGGFASILITNQMLEHYGITSEQLHQDAFEVAQKNAPLSIKNMDEIMYEMTDGFMGSQDAPQSPIWVATNENRFNGASVIAYPGFMDMASEQLNGSFYILPSSIHEVLMVQDSFGMRAQELKTMITEINETTVGEKEKLTDNVYHYDSVARVFEQADQYEKRNEKEQSRKSVLGELGEKKQVCRTQEPREHKEKKKDGPEL